VQSGLYGLPAWRGAQAKPLYQQFVVKVCGKKLVILNYGLYVRIRKSPSDVGCILRQSSVFSRSPEQYINFLLTLSLIKINISMFCSPLSFAEYKLLEQWVITPEPPNVAETMG